MKIVHIIPTFNEKDNIGQMLSLLEKLKSDNPKWPTEILVVDDCSPDGTAKIVGEYQKQYKNIHLISKNKEGLGKALIQGYEYAISKLKADVVIPNDADFQWDPKDYPRLMAKIEEGYDVAVASRHVKGSKIVGWDWFRKLNHNISNVLFAWFVAGVHEVIDHAGNFKAIRVKGVLERVRFSNIKNAGFSFQLNILYELSKTKARFTEVPVIFHERKLGKSKIGLNRYYLRDIFEYIRSSLLIRFDRNASFFKYVVVGGTGFIIQFSLETLLMVKFHIEESNAVSIGAEAAIICNFILNNLWTFSHKKIPGAKILLKFLMFNLVSVGSIIIQKVAILLGTTYVGRDVKFVLALNIVTIVLFVIPYSYFMYNRFIWKNKK